MHVLSAPLSVVLSYWLRREKKKHPEMFDSHLMSVIIKGGGFIWHLFKI